MIYVHGKKDGIKRKKRPKDKKFQCAICDKIFSDDYNLNCHVKSVHHKIRDHCCEKCGKRFSIAQSLKKHDIRSHGGIDGGRILYKCDYCINGKPFKGPGVMEIHLRLVHKIEGPLNIKPEGYDEKMAKKVNKVFWKKRKSKMPTEPEECDDEKLEKKSNQNLSSFEDQQTAMSGVQDNIPMRNSKDEDDQIEENYIGIHVRSMNTEESSVNEDGENQYNMENKDFDNSNKKSKEYPEFSSEEDSEDEVHEGHKKFDVNMKSIHNLEFSSEESEDEISSVNEIGTYFKENQAHKKSIGKPEFSSEESKDDEISNFHEVRKETNVVNMKNIEDSNNIETKIIHEEIDMDYDNYYNEAYSSDINDDENEDLKLDIKDEDELEKFVSSEHLVELHEPEILKEILHIPSDEGIDIQSELLNNQKKEEKEKEKKFLEVAKDFWRQKMSTQVLDQADVSEKPISSSNSETISSDNVENQKIAEALENLYENFVPTYMDKQSTSYDGENQGQYSEFIFNEPKQSLESLETLDIGPQIEIKEEEAVELDEYVQSNKTETVDEECDQNIKIENNEITTDENEIITNRFGHVVDQKIKCNYCDKIYFGKWAAKSIRFHCRLVHKAPKLREAKNEVTKEQFENSDTKIKKCKFCDKTYLGPTASKSMKWHMKSHSGIHHKCHICETDFLHKFGSLVWHLKFKHQCANVCEKCRCMLFHILYFLNFM